MIFHYFVGKSLNHSWIKFDTVNLYDFDSVEGFFIKLHLFHKNLQNYDATLRISINYILSPIARHGCLCVGNTCLSFFEPNTKSVRVWKLDRINGLIGPVKNISTTDQIETTAISENFLLGFN